MATTPPFRRLALVVGGGPAPGINGVISAVTIEAGNRGIDVIGIEDGYKWLVNGEASKIIQQHQEENPADKDFAWLSKRNPSHLIRLTRDDVKAMYIRGGSMIGTSRTNPTKKPEDMARVIDVFQRLQIDALVSIGGDDTAFSASQVYEKFNKVAKLRVAHVPKTIDNDLPLPGSTPTFGFETARHYGVSTVRNLAEDARTTARWYLIVSMGRAAGHLALGIGKASAATLTIIPEEFGLDAKGRPNKITVKHLCDIILGSIIKRSANNKPYGVVVLAEGLIESLKDELKIILDNTSGKYGTYETDAFGHLRLGEIEFAKLIRDLLSERLMEPKKAKDARDASPSPLHDIIRVPVKPCGLEVTFIDKDLGYELRSADPIPFDAEYTRDLGYSAVKFLLSPEAGQFGAIIGFIQGGMVPMKFADMIDPETKKMQTRIVNITGEGYEVARRYMIRLEPRDFNHAETLVKLAEVSNRTPDEFRREFEYLV